MHSSNTKSANILNTFHILISWPAFNVLVLFYGYSLNQSLFLYSTPYSSIATLWFVFFTFWLQLNLLTKPLVRIGLISGLLSQCIAHVAFMLLAVSIKRAFFGAMPHTQDLQTTLIAFSNLSFQVLVLTLLEHSFRIKEKYYNLKLDYKKAEILSLKQKSKPHFTYNTLNLIATEISSRPKLAEVLIYNLSDLMRRINQLSSDYCELEEELNIVNNYLNIQRSRFEGNINFNISLSNDCQNELIPPLIVLPLVENAFKHGLSPSNKTNFISITADIINNNLVIKVVNNLSPNSIGDFQIGSGIESIKNLLDFNYPKEHEFSFNSSNNLVTAEIIIKRRNQHGIHNNNSR